MRPYFRTFRLLSSAVLAVVLGGATSLPAPVNKAMLDIDVTGARSAKGVVRLALCPPRTGFPDCKAAALRTASAPVERGQARFQLTELPAGSFAVSVFHDENDNGRMDSFVGIPREGYGISRNPPFRARAPRFDEAEIVLAGHGQITIALRYLM